MLHGKNTIAIPPGATIHDQLCNRGMSQKEFALRMDMSEKHISHLINGKVELTKDVALRLEFVLGLSANFWNNLEMIYRDQLVRVKTELARECDKEIARNMPYSKMASLGWVPVTRKIEAKIDHLRSFFEVARLEAIHKLTIPGIAYRASNGDKTNDYMLAAWAQKAKLEARDNHTEDINIQKLKRNLSKIRALTTKSPDFFCDELKSMLAECGVAIVFLPHIGGSFLHGATFIDGGHIVIGLTVRGKFADLFWFSLFHELGHIFKGHIYNLKSFDNDNEKQADEYARDYLIPPSEYENFVNCTDKSAASIISFAKQINIDPGIVLGRLQKDGIVDYSWHHRLKTKYAIQ